MSNFPKQYFFLGHMTNSKRLICTFTRPATTKLCRVLTVSEGLPPTRSYVTFIIWSHDADDKVMLYLRFYKTYMPHTWHCSTVVT